MRPSCLDRRVSRPRQHLVNVSVADFHLHSADFDFEVIVINLAGDSSCAAHRFELDRVSFRDMLYHPRLSVGIALIGARAVRDYGRIELLAEIAAELGNAGLGMFRALLRRCRRLASIGRLARMIPNTAEPALQLL